MGQMLLQFSHLFALDEGPLHQLSGGLFVRVLQRLKVLDLGFEPVLVGYYGVEIALHVVVQSFHRAS